MKCIECKREITANEDFVEHNDIAVHDACSFRYRDRLTNQKRLAGMVSALIEEVNAGKPEDLADAIVAALTQNHRTLQQAFLGAVKLAITKYGQLDQGMHTDLRNESAHAWAAEVAKIPNSDIRFPLL